MHAAEPSIVTALLRCVQYLVDTVMKRKIIELYKSPECEYESAKDYSLDI